MRAIYEWGALLSAASAIGCLIFWGVSISGVLSSPTTGFDVFLTPGDGRYVVSEHGNAWFGFNLKTPAEADRLRKRVGREQIAQWKGPGFLVFISGQSDQPWLVGGSMLIPMFASAIVATSCFVAHRRATRKRQAMPKESSISKSPTTSKRRGLRLSMVVIVSVLCLRLSWWVIAAERQRRAVAAIEEFGGNVDYFQNYNQAMGVPLALLRRWLPPVYSCEVGYARLDKTQITDAGLAHLQRLTGLHILYLWNTQITDKGLTHLQGLTGLDTLYLQNTHVTGAGLADLQGLTNLRALHLDGTQVTDPGLAYLQRLTRLQRLNLNGTQVTDAGLVHLKGLKALQGLYLWKAQVSGAGLVHLRGLKCLQELSLEDTPVTDAGLSNLQGLTSLRSIWLGGTQVTDAGLVHLQGLAGLQRLGLNGTQLTDAGLAHLQGLTGLLQLDLNGTHVTDAGVAELRKALPNCPIIGP
jgi:hypothetical protein